MCTCSSAWCSWRGTTGKQRAVRKARTNRPTTMLIDFFLHLKAKKLPVSTREFLTLLEAIRERVAGHSIDDFYFLSRTCLVKDEVNYDKFDQAFGEYFKGITHIPGLEAEIPEEWLQADDEEAPDARGKGQAGKARLGQADGGIQEAPGRSRRNATRAAASGSAPAAPRPSATAATTPRASASAASRPATARRSRSGRTASTATSTTRSSSARATSRSRCAACAASPAKAPRTNSTSTAPSPPRRATPAGSTS
jgi:hypothetical protein